MLFAIFPIVNLWASYRIKKLRKFLLLFVILTIGANFFIGLFVPWHYNFLLFLMIYIPLVLYYMGKWSKKWNMQLSSENEYI
jgi:hypothetical protein